MSIQSLASYSDISLFSLATSRSRSNSGESSFVTSLPVAKPKTLAQEASMPTALHDFQALQAKLTEMPPEATAPSLAGVSPAGRAWSTPPDTFTPLAEVKRFEAPKVDFLANKVGQLRTTTPVQTRSEPHEFIGQHPGAVDSATMAYNALESVAAVGAGLLVGFASLVPGAEIVIVTAASGFTAKQLLPGVEMPKASQFNRLA